MWQDIENPSKCTLQQSNLIVFNPLFHPEGNCKVRRCTFLINFFKKKKATKARCCRCCRQREVKPVKVQKLIPPTCHQALLCQKNRSTLGKDCAVMSQPQGAERCKERICESHTAIQQFKEKQQGMTTFVRKLSRKKNTAREADCNKTRISQSLFGLNDSTQRDGF